MNLELKNKILSEIKLTETQHNFREKVVEEFVTNLESIAKELDIKVEFFVGGSFGKNTYLKGSSDIDTFARFDKNYNDCELSNLLKKILDKTELNYEKQKGSRDYYSIEFMREDQDFKFEIVPNRKIRFAKDYINTTDISPFHVKYLQKKQKTNSELCDEIRLAKRFFKSKKLYGAESYISGFSGHVIDILIAKFKTLENFLNHARDNWNDEAFVDINKKYIDFNDAKKNLDSDKLSKLVVVDSILENRNAARALSDENYYKFIDVLNNLEYDNVNSSIILSEYDFKVDKICFETEINSHINYCVSQELKSLRYNFKIDATGFSEDIVGSKLLKLSKLIERKFEKLDFKVFERIFLIDIKNKKCVFLYKIENSQLPKIKEIIGPYCYMRDAYYKFRENKEEIVIKDSRYYARVTRDITNIEQVKNFTLAELEELLGRNIDFIKSIEVK